MLLEEKYVQGINKIIDEVEQKYPVMDPSELWCQLKENCATYSKLYSIQRKKSQEELMSTLEDNLQSLYKELDQNTENREVEIIEDGIKQTKNKLSVLQQEKTESAIFRSKCQYIRDGEKNSKYFFSLEKKRYNEKNMKCLITEKGKKIVNMSEILYQQTLFFEELYSKDPNVYFKMEPKNTDPKLNIIEKNFCESDLTEGELFDAMMTLRSNKCCGGDGLSIEFYRTFYKKIKSHMLRMFKHAKINNLLPLSTRRGMISLLPKPKKDSRYLKNVRALTLLNSDYKVLAKALDNRLKTVIPNLISDAQTGFLPGRDIAKNTRKSLDVMEFCRSQKKPAVIMSIDMSKCFDRVSYQSIYGALRFFNFGESFIKWISLFYTDFQVCTQNMGFQSRWWSKTRSVNQGCPISPTIYLLISELMSIKLKNHKDIHGIKIGDTEILLSQFADDTDLYLPFEKTVINAVLDVLTEVESNIGIKVSYDKTVLYRIGSIANTNAKCYTKRTIKWNNEPSNTLGIDLHHQNLAKNFEATMIRMEAVTKLWYYRQLTILGKVLILNTLVASLFVYKMTVVHEFPDAMIQRIENCFKDFIWNGKKQKIPLNILKIRKEQGGLGLVDIKAKHQSILLKWVKYAKEDKVIHELANEALNGLCENNMIWEVSLETKDISQLKLKNSFWKTILSVWCDFKKTQGNISSSATIKSQIIWYNSNIKIGQKVITPKSNVPWYVGDILTEKGFRDFDSINVSLGINWLSYKAIKEAIPKEWKRIVISQIDTHPGENIKSILDSTKPTGKIYRLLIDTDKAIISSAQKWQKLIGDNFDFAVHKEAFNNLYKITNITKLRAFQFRLLHNKVFCNNVLYHWKIKDTKMCDYCKEIQDITHLLYKCEGTKRIWKEIYKIYQIEVTDLTVNVENVIYNLVHPRPLHIANFITLVVKQFIYRCKCEERKPELKDIVMEIELIYSMEKYNAFINGNIVKHQNKWQSIKPDVTNTENC